MGRWEPSRRAARMRAGFDKGGLLAIRQDGALLGCCQAIRHPDHVEIASFYLEPAVQGQGLGRAVLEALLAGYPGLEARLDVLNGSPARAFWARMGFSITGGDAVEFHMSRPPRA